MNRNHTSPECIQADWIGAPSPFVMAGCTVRTGGVSGGAHASYNLGSNTADAPENVAANRAVFEAALGTPCWLEQVHGTEVVERTRANAAATLRADAQWTTQGGLVLTVLTADCLPVLFADQSNAVVAAAHAGWRGLAAGVLQKTVAALPVPPGSLHAWIGPAIGVRAYEVGEEVRQVFADSGEWDAQDVEACFQAGKAGKWQCDLAEAAERLMRGLGLALVGRAGVCTHDDARFYSFRRDGETGRQASFIACPAVTSE